MLHLQKIGGSYPRSSCVYYLHENQNGNGFILLLTACVPATTYLLGIACCFQQHLGQFPKHLLKKSHPGMLSRTRGLARPGSSMGFPRTTSISGQGLRAAQADLSSSCCCAASHRTQEMAEDEVLQSPEKTV